MLTKMISMITNGDAKVFHHRGTEDTEFYFVNCACGVVNNMKLFSVSSVSLW